MLNRIGYPCVSLITGRTTNRSCMLKSATPARLHALIQENLDDLDAILKHNLEHGWLLFRIGSSVIPFGSHPANQIKWWQEYQGELIQIGSLIQKNNMRLSFHPGQFTVLNAKETAIVSRAIDELVYSSRFLDELGLDASNKIVIHVGATYGDKPAATRRFVETVNALDESVRSRLVIENDERSYNPAEVLEISTNTGLPVVFDNLHYRANPGPGGLDDLLMQAFSTWEEQDGPPKVHFSSQADGGRTGNHAQLADPIEFERWLALWSATGEFDLMLEAKGKDVALLPLMEKAL